MESIICNISGSIRGNKGHSFQFLTTKFRMSNGLIVVKTLLSFQDSNQPLQQCMIQTDNQFLNSQKGLEIQLESAHLIISWFLVVLEISRKEKWISGPSRVKTKLEKERLHVLQRLNGQHVEDIFLHVFYTKDLKLIIASIFTEQMEQKHWKNRFNLLNYTMLAGNLIQLVYCLNQVSIKSKKWNSNKKVQNPKEFSNLEKEEKIVLSSKWWDSKWQMKNILTKVQKKLMQIITRSYKWNKLRKHKRLFHLKQAQWQVLWMLPLLPKWLPLKQEVHQLALIQSRIKKQRRIQVAKIGEWENSMMTMMKINTSLNRHRSNQTKHLPPFQLNRFNWVSMLLVEKRRKENSK